MGQAPRGASYSTLGTFGPYTKVKLNQGGSKIGFIPSAALTAGGSGQGSYTPVWNSTPPVIALNLKGLETTAETYKLAGTITDEQHVEDVYIYVSNQAAKIESRKVALESRAVDLVELAERLLHDYHERFAARELQASVEHRGRPIARGDAQAIEQILVNLVDNAIKYTEAGGSVVIRVAEEGAKVAVSVVDTGIGIPAADRERIFERFYRVDKARSRELGGTGLGLAIVKHVLLRHDAGLEIGSESGKGSTFAVRLPAARVERVELSKSHEAHVVGPAAADS